jgi:hypothetical protein
MKPKTKTFDCVEIKNRIQAERMAEFEAHRDEYGAYVEFVRARCERSDWRRRQMARLRKAGRER